MNVLIVEDEAHTATLLKEIIEQDSDFIVVDRLESIVDTVAYLHKHQKNLDLLFFDIHLADGYSFEIFKHIDVTVPIIFCTAFDSYAMNAIKNNGINYVLKPIKEKEIHEALSKYKQLISTLNSSKTQAVQFSTSLPQSYQENFLTQFREKTLIVKVKDIALFAVKNETVYLYTYNGKWYPLFKKLDYIESVCDPKAFYRVNRQMLVNRDAVISFEPFLNRKIAVELKIKMAEQVIVSRLKVTAFKEWLEL